MGWLWDRQSVCSQAADNAKRSISKARAVGLVLGVAAACAGAAAAQVMSWSDGVGKRWRSWRPSRSGWRR